MNKELKNRGLNAPVIFIGVVIIGVLIGAAFVPGNEIYNASLLDKVLGYGLIIGAGIWAAKSATWMDKVIKSDRLLTWAQIIGTIIFIASGMTILVV